MARRGSSKRTYLVALALILEAIFILAIPLGANLSVPVSPSQCPPPVSKPVEQVWNGSLIIDVASLEMKIKGVKKVEPYILVRNIEGRTYTVSLGVYNGSHVHIIDLLRSIPRFVGPMTLDVDVGERVTNMLLPPNAAYYDPNAKHYVFQYFYWGTNTVGTVFVKPLYHSARVTVSLREPARVGLELCIGKSCWLAKVVDCGPGNCTIEASSSQPFQYTKIFYVYRCGILNAVASEEGGLRIELRTNAWIPIVIFAAAAAATVYMGVKRTKRFK
ncbi:MAG: hypothetical protein GXO32_04825 [Crenarchaeota archaeon]|nr:hypothetical protein [Thermoproteota archaeon]